MPRTVLTYDEQPHSLSWVLDEPMRRTSHALVADGRVWLVDPVDVDEAMGRVAQLGEPAGVLQLLDRHNRDNAAIAQRLGVPYLRLPHSVPGSPFEVVQVIGVPKWREIALWWAAERTLVVAEVVGTGPFFTGGDPPAGIHLLLRLRPPGVLRRFEPEHLLVGHGAGVHGDAAAPALEEAIARSRRDLPLALLKMPTALRG